VVVTSQGAGYDAAGIRRIKPDPLAQAIKLIGLDPSFDLVGRSLECLILRRVPSESKPIKKAIMICARVIPGVKVEGIAHRIDDQ